MPRPIVTVKQNDPHQIRNDVPGFQRSVNFTQRYEELKQGPKTTTNFKNFPSPQNRI